jgi:uncharacterized membrane protein YbhN (UPF0104 family)
VDGRPAQETDPHTADAADGVAETDRSRPADRAISASQPPSSDVKTSSDDETRFTARLLNRLIPASVTDKAAARRKISKSIAYGLSISIAVLTIFVLTRTFMQIDLTDLRAAIAATSAERIVAAFICTTISFLALTGYDALALRQLKLHVPYPTTALASFTSYAISFTLGFPLITAGTVRYWIYSTKGLSGGKVASLTVIAGLTFWLGMALLIGIGFAVRAGGVSHLDHLDPLLNRMIGIAIIAALVAYLIWASKGHRHARIQGFELELPGLWLTLGQICLGLIDLCAAAGVLYILLEPPRAIDYLTFVTVYVFGSLLGIASNAPGGIGVFEATMLKTVPAHSEASLFAALLLFRIIYYFVPFVLALAMLGAHESIRRWNTLRDAMTGNDDDDPDGDTVG